MHHQNLEECRCTRCLVGHLGYSLQSSRTRQRHEAKDASSANKENLPAILHRTDSHSAVATTGITSDTPAVQVEEYDAQASMACDQPILPEGVPPPMMYSGESARLDQPNDTSDASGESTTLSVLDDPANDSDDGDINLVQQLPTIPVSERPATVYAPLAQQDQFSELVPAFREVPAVRYAYMYNVLGNVFDNITEDASQRGLVGALNTASLMGQLPTYPRPARTIVTAKRRLGLDLDAYIETYPICTVCFKAYSFDDIPKMASPSCAERGCNGVVYIRKQSNDGKETRRPSKIQSLACPIKSLRRFLLRPDFVRHLTDIANHPQLRPADDPSGEAIMHDVYDGAAFGNLNVGLKRVVKENGEVEDVEIAPGSRKRLRDCELGLSFTLNIDWCVEQLTILIG